MQVRKGSLPNQPRRVRPWLQWAGAAAAVCAIVALLAAALFTGLTHLRPSWRVAQGPSLAVERAAPPDQAGRRTDDARVFAR